MIRSKTPTYWSLDDWGLAAMDAQTRRDLMEIVDDRSSHRATIITSQLPIEHWHQWMAIGRWPTPCWIDSCKPSPSYSGNRCVERPNDTENATESGGNKLRIVVRCARRTRAPPDSSVTDGTPSLATSS
ncbi:MAG: ATP-binding protein [Rhodoferax sp.]|nr:ATP-binding protein [Rhodoferax sp.]